MERVNLSKVQIRPNVLNLVSSEIVKMYHVLPIRLSPQINSEEARFPLEIVIPDNLDSWTDKIQGELDFAFGRRVIPSYVSKPEEIEGAIARLYPKITAVTFDEP